MAYFAVSVDDPDTNKKFAEELQADYPILSDPEKKVAAAYGVLSASGFAASSSPSTEPTMWMPMAPSAPAEMHVVVVPNSASSVV